MVTLASPPVLKPQISAIAFAALTETERKAAGDSSIPHLSLYFASLVSSIIEYKVSRTLLFAYVSFSICAVINSLILEEIAGDANNLLDSISVLFLSLFPKTSS